MKLKEEYHNLNSIQRLYQYDKPIIALTGGIATGKSTVTKLLEQRGLTIIDADQLVKSIYANQESKDFIQKNYPLAWGQNEINFKKLRELVFSDSSIKSGIENFIYQRLPAAFKEATSKVQDQNFYVYDVPLLFERALETKVDLTILVYAPRKVQLARLISRDGSNEEIGNKILDQQLDIEEKKLKADLILDNSGPMTELVAEVDRLLLQILE